MTDTEKKDLVQWFFRLRDRLKGEAQRVVDTAIDKLAPTSPAPEPEQPKWTGYDSDTCECGSPKLSGWAYCPPCIERKCLPESKKANRTRIAAYKREMEKR